jgi:hypothetical protein
MFKHLMFVLISVSALAAPNNEELKARESVSEKARARMYEGGADEQPLIVQQTLVEPRAEGSESAIQKKLLNSEDGEGTEPSNDETSSGF